MRRRSPYNTCSSWHSSQSIWYQAGSCGSHLGPSVWMLLSGLFCTVLPRTTFWWPWFHGGHRMLHTNPQGNVWVLTQHWCLDREDIAGSTLYLFMYVQRQDSNHNFYHGFPKILDKGRQTDIILFLRSHLLTLQSGGIPFNALGNAHGISVCVHTKRDPPCTLGDWAHSATGEDSWQLFCPQIMGNTSSWGRFQLDKQSHFCKTNDRISSGKKFDPWQVCFKGR